MSIECPCIHYKPDGICAKYSVNGDLSYCVQGPCPDETPSNADRIRAMSDKELAHLIIGNGTFECRVCEIGDQRVCDIECEKHCIVWLQQPAEEEA